MALVLDDYHLSEEPAIHDSLALLLSHLPPWLHLAIAGRRDPPLPLARWRARGQLAEPRAEVPAAIALLRAELAYDRADADGVAAFARAALAHIAEHEQGPRLFAGLLWPVPTGSPAHARSADRPGPA